MKELQLNAFYKIPTPSPAKKRINTMLIFDKQYDALQYYLSSSIPMHIFSFEKDSPGKRQFTVDTIESFYDHYMGLKTKHFYELIPSFSPCHLYLDLEFYVAFNNSLDGDKLLDLFISDLSKHIRISLDSGIQDIVKLTSHTNMKFSVHLIFHLQNAFFKSNRECKFLMQNFLIHTDNDYSVNTHDGKSLFCDMSVYSKNRQFRLYLSSKFGKSTIMNIKDSEPCLNVFKSTLITNCPFNENTVILEVEPEYAPEINRPSKAMTIKLDNPIIYGSDSSIFDEYMNSILQGQINKIIKRSGKIIVSVIGDRYCERIRRQHKSNGIYYVVDTKSGEYYQMCHDPDCAGFSGQRNTLPDEIYFEIMDIDIDYLKSRIMN